LVDEKLMNQSSLTTAGLFAGIGGFELGLAQAGFETKMLCELMAPARSVLSTHFPEAEITDDVQDLDDLPDVDLLTAGFPCKDLSAWGDRKGITGRHSGLVTEIFRLLEKKPVPMVLIENVKNLLHINKGEVIQYMTEQFEALGYRWAYRVVDSRFTGVPQKRLRIIFFAAKDVDPKTVLFADDAGEPKASYFKNDAYTFYWREGARGSYPLPDAAQTLKAGRPDGGSNSDGIWVPGAEVGKKVVVFDIEDAEQLQGFPRNWTEPSHQVTPGMGQRWHQVGNAVTVGVSRWVGERIVNPGDPVVSGKQMKFRKGRWPQAAYNHNGEVLSIRAFDRPAVSFWPKREPYTHLSELVDLPQAKPLSARATEGFLSRVILGQKQNQVYNDAFVSDIAEHLEFMSA
jgi:DNA (cytosine-5)-methyltransferase 1